MGKPNLSDDLPGFSLPNPVKEEKFGDILEERGRKKNKKGGGFQVMGLSFPVLKGIIKRGYKVPTPIQRKTIPLILEGRDVVAMAKTGSGKTACFLIPLFEKLKSRLPSAGARALILSPTRELAVQTFKFFKEIGKFMDFKVALVLGGDSMDSQFTAIHACPDVIVATPGRFLHLCVEMELKLSSVEYVVFDEADRLFEMGFGEQLNETIHRLPESKQVVMFSATLPKLLVDFAKAGLSDPVLIRLDVETKLPEGLELRFLHCRSDERYTAMLALLKYVIPSDAQTVVFAGTQHHVELISYILTEAKISNTLIYSAMDPSARKINTAKFTHKKASVLIVTDVAARGIDIPSLDYVINLHFPGKPKLFIHRVGRCARAGRSGTAYSIVSNDDEAHLLDLHLFLNRPFELEDTSKLGVIPQDLLEEEHATVLELLQRQHISGVYRTSVNAYKKYLSTRPPASADSNKRVKSINFVTLDFLDDFRSKTALSSTSVENKQIHEDLLHKMKHYRPSGTVFELNPNHKSVPLAVMKEKRAAHGTIIEKFKKQSNDRQKEQKDKLNEEIDLAKSNEDDIKNTFGKVVSQKKRKNCDDLYEKKKPKRRKPVKDEEHYIPYQSSDKHTEDGLAINAFDREAQNAQFSVNEKVEEFQHRPGSHKWDRIRKKMVSVQDPRQGKIRTESGLWIPATYKTGRYKDWKEKSKIDAQLDREDDDNVNEKPMFKDNYPMQQWKRHMMKVEAKKRQGINNELRTPEQIVKSRIRLEIIKKKQQVNTVKKAENRKRSMRKSSVMKKRK